MYSQYIAAHPAVVGFRAEPINAASSKTKNRLAHPRHLLPHAFQ